MSKIKSASQFDGEAWSSPTPIGVDDANIDVTSATTDPNTDSGIDLGSADVTVASGDTGASAWTKFNRFRKRVSNAFGSFTGKTLVSSYDTTNPGDKVYTASVLNNYMSNVLGYTGTTTPTINGSQQTVSSALNSIFGNGVKSISRSGTTFTATRLDGTTFTFDQQDNNTTYSASTGLSLSSNAFSIKNSGVTAGSYGPSANATPAYGATFNVPYITVNAQGQLTAASTKTVKIPASDNTNTWRGIVNNLASTSTTDSLSAAQGKALNDNKAAISATPTLVSNTNGIAYKFPNKIMICVKSVSANVAITTPWGAWYDGSMSLGSWPVAFSNIHGVTCVDTGGQGAAIEYLTNYTNSSAGTVYLARPTANTASVSVSVVAFGQYA